MTIKVKTAAEAAKKWTEVASTKGSYYEAGVAGAGTDWLNGATMAAPAYKAAVSSANIDKMFSGGVKRAGADKYQRKASGVGKDRYAPGVQAATADYQAGVDPMLQTIASLTLTARQPRGSEANLTRVREVATALNKKRLALRAAGA